VLLEGFVKSGGEFTGAIVIEQAEELNGKVSGRFATLEGGLQEGLAFRD
jgi:hypothetical protein